MYNQLEEKKKSVASVNDCCGNGSRDSWIVGIRAPGREHGLI